MLAQQVLLALLLASSAGAVVLMRLQVWSCLAWPLGFASWLAWLFGRATLIVTGTAIIVPTWAFAGALLQLNISYVLM